MHRPMLIAFSGTDGGGKTTQIELLVGRMRRTGNKVCMFWSRGGYTPGMVLLKDSMRRLWPGKVPAAGPSDSRTKAFQSPRMRRLWLTLAILDLFFWYNVWLRWKHLLGYSVVLDRYYGDTALDFVLNFPQETITEWWLWRVMVWLAPRPQAAFLLLVPVQESERRSKLKHEPFPDSSEVLQKRLDHYERLAVDGCWQCLDGCRSESELHRDICEACGIQSPVE